MKGIDYRAIHIEAWKNKGVNEGSFPYVKAVIEAYEAQKTQPEWVPLDLATVKQGQEVRNSIFCGSGLFVCQYKSGFVFDDLGVLGATPSTNDWLMRAPKPKTVKVKVYRHVDDFTRYMALLSGVKPIDSQAWAPVGEGEIEVRE